MPDFDVTVSGRVAFVPHRVVIRLPRGTVCDRQSLFSFEFAFVCVNTDLFGNEKYFRVFWGLCVAWSTNDGPN